jgi:hypothetical protein
MDDRTGHIYEFKDEDVREVYDKMMDGFYHSMTKLEAYPKPNCPICGGKGSIKSKPYTKDGHICFFRPCKCTKDGDK